MGSAAVDSRTADNGDWQPFGELAKDSLSFASRLAARDDDFADSGRYAMDCRPDDACPAPDDCDFDDYCVASEPYRIGRTIGNGLVNGALNKVGHWLARLRGIVIRRPR